ncbi:MAG TPA: PQQ-binding-like beta-propeller repeat protein [Actinopolymorphaceae bacterium]
MHERSPSAGMARRRFLRLAGAAAAALPLGSVLTAPAHARTAREPLRFAVVSDTHANVSTPERQAWLRRIFESIEAADPAFVLNCGDITEYGGDDEFAAYLETIPDGLKPRLRHVPGNHETRWDVHAGELYHALLGPTPFSFDAASSGGGVHIVGLDPTQLLQEPGRFGREHLDWLGKDLRRAGARPTIAFLHFPLGGDHYYVDDQPEILEALSGTSVRAVFAGHIHRLEVQRFDGFTQVAADDAKDGRVYYWVEEIDAALRVEEVRLADDGSALRRDVTEIPLRPNADRFLRPTTVELAPRAGTVEVDVRLHPRADAVAVKAQVYPQHVFGAGNAGDWVDLRQNGESWSGSVDVTALAAGVHQVQVRARAASGATSDRVELFSVAPSSGGGPKVRWEESLPGQVQGALAERDGLVVAASTKGEVRAFDARGGRHRRVWSARLGPVYRGPVFGGDGESLFVPSKDHRLYALSAGDGRIRWRFTAPEPVLSTPLVTTVAGVETVLFTAGERLYAVSAADGTERWSADLHGFFAGTVACDGDRVYTGGGDGNCYAFDAATGRELWTFSTTTRDTAYSRLIYGPWDDVVELLPSGRVLVSTVAGAFALDRATGGQAWSLSGSFVYTPSILLDSGLLVIDEWGEASLVDPETGAALWGPSQLVPRAFNAGPVVTGDTGWLVGTTGLLVGFDLTSGAVVHRLQLGTAWSFSTPVVVDGVLVTADQAGVVRGVAL